MLALYFWCDVNRLQVCASASRVKLMLEPVSGVLCSSFPGSCKLLLAVCAVIMTCGSAVLSSVCASCVKQVCVWQRSGPYASCHLHLEQLWNSQLVVCLFVPVSINEYVLLLAYGCCCCCSIVSVKHVLCYLRMCFLSNLLVIISHH